MFVVYLFPISHPEEHIYSYHYLCHECTNYAACLHNIDHYRYIELLTRYLVLPLLRTFSEDLDPINRPFLETRDLDINYHVTMLFGREA